MRPTAMLSIALCLALISCNGTEVTSASKTDSPATIDSAAQSNGQTAAAQNQEQEPKINPYRQFQLHTLQKAVVTTTAENGDELEFDVWVMDEEAKRQEGMMFLEEEDFTEYQGMIFVFQRATHLSFWMKNTFVPLDIAYLDADGVAVQVYTMRPFDTTTDYGSRRPAKYALEVKAGTFEKYGIRAGTKFEIPEDVIAKN